MKVLHLNAGNETGGGMHHILLLLSHLPKDEVILGVFEAGELKKRAEKSGIQTVLFPQKSQLDISVVKKVRAYIQENNIDFLHTHGPRANLFGRMIVKKTNCRLITTVHSNPADDFLGKGLVGKLFFLLNKSSIKKADYLFAISERFKTMLIDYGIPSNKIQTILNGIDFQCEMSRPYSRSDFGLDEQDFVLVMVARLEKVKCHTVALEALKLASPSCENPKLLLIGSGTEQTLLEERVKELGLESQVRFLGNRDDVNRILPIADAALLTSKSESFPLVLLEAARASIPAISTDVGGVNLMIPTKEYGWVNPVYNVQEICRSIEEAFSEKRKHVLHVKGNRFHNHCKDRFSIENQAKTIYETYEKLRKKV